MSEVAPDSWQDALTRRLRTLVRLSPLHRIEATKGHRGEPLIGVDMRALGLRALDLVIERMGLGGGMTHDELRDELVPLISRMSPDLDARERVAVADAVIRGLLNERERRWEFQEPYTAFEGDEVTRRTVDFRLLRETEETDGGVILRATDEAINIYAGMLEYPVEDAQIAEEAVLRAQLHRGQIADAVRTAQRARVRSIEYEQKIQAFLDTVRRDVKQVDWIRDVLTVLEAAREHLDDRQRHEQDLLRLIDARLDVAIGEAAGQLAALHEVVDECYRRHMQLHRRLIPANQEYLREQDRQVFRPRLAASLPDLEAEVLRSALALSTGALAGLADALLARFLPPRSSAPGPAWQGSTRSVSSSPANTPASRPRSSPCVGRSTPAMPPARFSRATRSSIPTRRSGTRSPGGRSSNGAQKPAASRRSTASASSPTSEGPTPRSSAASRPSAAEPMCSTRPSSTRCRRRAPGRPGSGVTPSSAISRGLTRPTSSSRAWSPSSAIRPMRPGGSTSPAASTRPRISGRSTPSSRPASSRPRGTSTRCSAPSKAARSRPTPASATWSRTIRRPPCSNSSRRIRSATPAWS